MQRSTWLAVVLVGGVSAAGCAQIWGLDKTTQGEAIDAADAPGVCALPLQCASDGTEVCGQLFGVGTAQAAVPLPTGIVCTSSSEGPCSLTLEMYAKAAFLAGDVMAMSTPVAVDDCGRFKAKGLPADSQPDLALVVSGPNMSRTATLILNRTTTPTPVRAPIVPNESSLAWINAAGVPLTTTAAYLLQFPTNGADRSGWNLQINSTVPMQQMTPPFAFYFAGDAPFATLTPTQAQTGPSGTALAVPAAGPMAFTLGGVGASGTPICAGAADLKLVPMTLVFLDLTSC